MPQTGAMPHSTGWPLHRERRTKVPQRRMSPPAVKADGTEGGASGGDGGGRPDTQASTGETEKAVEETAAELDAECETEGTFSIRLHMPSHLPKGRESLDIRSCPTLG